MRSIYLALVALLLLGCTQAPDRYSQGSPSIFLKYHFTSEAVYEDFTFNGFELTYAYFNNASKCPDLPIQTPCWTERDLSTNKRVLSKDEITELFDLVNETHFMDLKGNEPPTNQRYYPYTLEVRDGSRSNSVVYKSYLGASEMPEAFVKIPRRLKGYVGIDVG